MSLFIVCFVLFGIPTIMGVVATWCEPRQATGPTCHADCSEAGAVDISLHIN